jgi:putative pyruvate formate lyase activating enzyme
MRDFDRLWVWQEPALAGRLSWYRAVAANRMPAKFAIAATIPVAVALGTAGEDELWAEIDRLTPEFLALRQRIWRAEALLGERVADASLLDLCSELAQRMLTHCNFCRWYCGVDRSRGGKLGACKLAADARVSSYFHHPGEELVYRGTEGSGTIFFTSCNMRCAFCQNGDISTDKDNGMVVDARTLAAMAWLLRLEGCHNINWVGGDPTIHLHAILGAIALLGDPVFTPTRADLVRARPAKSDYFGLAAIDPADGTHAGRFNAPMLWNSNFFMTPETMKLLRLLMDVWLPDFKFGPGRCAVTLARTSWYWETVTANLRLLSDWGEDFTIRHLVMPNHVECCTYPVLDWIAEQIPDAPVNIMDQYHPDNFCDPASAKYDPRHADLARRPTHAEIHAAYQHASRNGLRFEAITHERQKLGVAL